jgi:hypothetical protein
MLFSGEMIEWSAAPQGNLECTSRKGLVTADGSPVCKEGMTHCNFISTNTTCPPGHALPLLGTGPGQFDHIRVKYRRGGVLVGFKGGNEMDDYNDEAFVYLNTGKRVMYPDISHDGQTHSLTHSSTQCRRQAGQTVHFRVAQVGVGRFTVEMQAAGDDSPWKHFTPNGKPLRPKKKGSTEPVDGLRLQFGLFNDGALVSDVCVGRSMAASSSGERALRFNGTVNSHHRCTVCPIFDITCSSYLA